MKVKIVNAEKLARTRKSHPNGVGGEGKDFVGTGWHRQDNLKRFRWKIAPDIISYLLARVLHVAHENSAAFLIEIGSTQPRDLFEAAEKIAKAITFCIGTDEGRLLRREK
jgi:hypothetical protein